MFLAILTLITALCISAVAIYYSVAGLVAIFAAAAVPIMIMGGVLEVGKLVTAVWLHKYWKQATWWLRSYLSIAVVVLMLITSMGIFGFLSKAHIEQTSASEESIARIESIDTETARLMSVIGRAENKIRDLENSGMGADANIQSQIDKEQERIDKAFDRIKPAIEQQNQIITDARASDNDRTKPYEDQLASITAEILRLETSAKEYETKIENLESDSSAVEPLLEQIAALEEEIIRVTNQLNSNESGQVRAGQAIIGVTSDGLFGGNTRTALATWVSAQRDRITQIQGEVAQVRKDATSTVDAERTRLADVVKDIRTVQIPALKDRELTMLGKIDEVRQSESPVIQTARDEIQRLRESAESQVAQSQALIERLQQQLANRDNADEVQTAIDEQLERVRTASSEIEILTDEKYELEAEYRKLEAEVGPVKYIAEFIYGEAADSNMLEEAVRWVIIIIIFVFDPLAVLLLIASQYTFDYIRRNKDDDGERLRLERRDYERARAQAIVDNPGFTLDDSVPPTDKDSVEHTIEEQKEEIDDGGDDTGTSVEEPDGEPTVRTGHKGRGTADGMVVARGDKGVQLDGTMDQSTDGNIQDDNVESNERDGEASNEANVSERGTVEADEESVSNSTQERVATLKEKEQDETFQLNKEKWKEEHPNETIKLQKALYLEGKIDKLPWESEEPLINDETGYIQNEEQGSDKLWNKIKDND